MNIFSMLPGISEGDTTDPDEAKRARIDFHRLHVRNGPVKFSNKSTGQVRREGKRALARKTSKARREQIKAYLDGQRRAAVLRGQLQILGVLPTVAPVTVSAEQRDRALYRVVAHFIKPEEMGSKDLDIEHLACQRALNLWQRLTGQPETRLEVVE